MGKLRRKSFEIRFYEGILKNQPNCVNVLIPLGDIYTKKKFYKEGLEVDRRLAILRPDDSTVYYNLSCSLSLVGCLEESLKALKQAVLLGYNEYSYILKDCDLKNLRQLDEFKIFFNKLRRLRTKIKKVKI